MNVLIRRQSFPFHGSIPEIIWMVHFQLAFLQQAFNSFILHDWTHINNAMLSKSATVSTYHTCHCSLNKTSTLRTCAPRNSDLKIIRIFASHENQVYTFAFAQLCVTKQKLNISTIFPVNIGKCHHALLKCHEISNYYNYEIWIIRFSRR